MKAEWTNKDTLTPSETTDVTNLKLKECSFGYEPPINLIIGDVEAHIEDNIMETVHNYGIYVNKEELQRALIYDRGQYTAGYEKGFSEGLKEGKRMVLQAIKDLCGDVE